MRKLSYGVFALVLFHAGLGAANPALWQGEWPHTDFDKRTVEYGEIFSGGVPKDGIPAVDKPTFVAVDAAKRLSDTEPVIGLIVNGVAKAYPLNILI